MAPLDSGVGKDLESSGPPITSYGALAQMVRAPDS